MPKNDNTTTATCLVTDQGNGGIMCNTCGYYENNAVYWSRCPECKRLVKDIGLHINRGGSDF